MKKFIVLTFLFMGWAFYELSGGSDFEPKVNRAPEAEQIAQAEETIFVAPRSEDVAAQVPTTQVSQSQDNPAAQPLAQAAEADVVLAAVTPSLVGSVQPTPKSELTKLGPTSESLAAQQTLGAQTLSSATGLDFRRVDGSRVNMRSGPSTNNGVIATLARNTEVEVLEVPGNGWVQLQVLSTGQIGWMAERLLTKN